MIPRRLALFLVFAPAAGCFDVHTDASPVLIDNFDEGNLPADHHFDQWRCGQYKPDTKQSCVCGYDDASYRSAPYSMQLAALVSEGSDEAGSAGAQLYTQADVPEDLSHFGEIVFGANLQQGTLPNTAALYVELYCSLARSVDQSIPGNLCVQTSLKVTDMQALQSQTEDGWAEYAIALADFLPQTNYSGGGIAGGLTACLERVDSIHFSLNAGLPKNGTGQFVFHLDDVYVR